MYSRFGIRNVDQNGLLGDVQNDRKPLHESVCKWLTDNTRWREWVPKEELDCKLGEFVEKSASEAGLGKCTKCNPGYSSEGGSVLRCYPCQPGDIRAPRSSLSAWPFRCAFCAESTMGVYINLRPTRECHAFRQCSSLRSSDRSNAHTRGLCWIDSRRARSSRTQDGIGRHFCAGTGQMWQAHACHICTGTGLARAWQASSSRTTAGSAA
jgi:hypothetical protein